MKILGVTDDNTLFENGKKIEFFHEKEYQENNYAKFKDLDENAFKHEFSGKLVFKKEHNGFIFGDRREMFYVPCFSEQSGFYNRSIDIFYDNEKKLKVTGKWVDTTSRY